MQDVEHIAGRARQATEVPARRDRTYEHALVGEVLLHPNAVAENRAPRVGTRWVDGEHGHALALVPVGPDQAVDERALAGARRTGDADHVRLPLVGKHRLQELEGVRVALVDQTASPSQRSNVPAFDPLHEP